MKTIILKSGKRIKYREGFITPEGMEIIVPDNSLMPEEKREFKNKVSDIEEDLNSTSTENLDADVLGITSQVE